MRHQRWQAPSDDDGPSWAAWLTVHGLRFGVRPLIEWLPDTPETVRLARRLVAGFLAVAGPPAPATVFRPVTVATSAGGRVRGEWAIAAPSHRAGGLPDPRRRRPAGAVLYLHGSAFAVASARTHRGITSRLAARTGLPVFGCDYRLAPTHRYPAAADDVAAAWDWLVAHGFDPARTVVAGDSAGGHLAVDLAASLRRAGRPGPAGLVLFSPLIDLTLDHARRREQRVGPDPMLSAGRAAKLLAHHLVGADLASPRLRFDAEVVAGLPPLLVHAGGAEMLADDAVHLADLVRAAGGRADLHVWPGQPHVFQAMTALLPEASLALDEAAAFIRDRYLEHAEAS